MNVIFNTMYTFFQNSKLEGSYFLLFALSLVVLYVAEQGKHRWLSLFPVAMVLLVVGNPLTVWIISRIIPTVANYYQLVVLMPLLIYIPFGATVLIDGLKTHRERVIVGIVLVLFISICGNLFGFFGGDTVTEKNKYNEERQEIIAYTNDATKDGGLVLAGAEILPFITAYGDNIPLLYGQDIMLYNGDLGIMDEYDDGMITIHNSMWTPEESFDSIVAMAYGYGCDIIIINKFEGAPEKVGEYFVDKETENYLIYRTK